MWICLGGTSLRFMIVSRYSLREINVMVEYSQAGDWLQFTPCKVYLNPTSFFTVKQHRGII